MWPVLPPTSGGQLTSRSSVDGTVRPIRLSGGTAHINATLAPGRHTVKVVAGDYQEAKNMEDVGPILQNTRSFTGKLVVKR